MADYTELMKILSDRYSPNNNIYYASGLSGLKQPDFPQNNNRSFWGGFLPNFTQNFISGLELGYGKAQSDAKRQGAFNEITGYANAPDKADFLKNSQYLKNVPELGVLELAQKQASNAKEQQLVTQLAEKYMTEQEADPVTAVMKAKQAISALKTASTQATTPPQAVGTQDVGTPINVASPNLTQDQINSMSKKQLDKELAKKKLLDQINPPLNKEVQSKLDNIQAGLNLADDLHAKVDKMGDYSLIREAKAMRKDNSPEANYVATLDLSKGPITKIGDGSVRKALMDAMSGPLQLGPLTSKEYLHSSIEALKDTLRAQLPQSADSEVIRKQYPKIFTSSNSQYQAPNASSQDLSHLSMDQLLQLKKTLSK